MGWHPVLASGAEVARETVLDGFVIVTAVGRPGQMSHVKKGLETFPQAELNLRLWAPASAALSTEPTPAAHSALRNLPETCATAR